MVNVQVLKSSTFLIKFLELVLGIVCVALTANGGVAITTEKQQVVHATYYGFFFVSAIVVISFILDAPVHPKLVMVLSCAATVMYITAGALNIELYDKAPKLAKNGDILGAGITALINSILYAVDVFLSWKQL